MDTVINDNHCDHVVFCDACDKILCGDCKLGFCETCWMQLCEDCLELHVCENRVLN